jgi:Holliday junction resolvase
MAKNKYGAKKDANHKELVVALEKMGVGVVDTSEKGGGFPDLICAVKFETLLVEIKNLKTAYGRRGLNDLQKKFAEEWTGGPVYVITSLDDCVLLANLELDSLYAYGGGAQVNVKAVAK